MTKHTDDKASQLIDMDNQPRCMQTV